MKAKDIKKGRYYLSISGEPHKVKYLFDAPELSPVNDSIEIIGKAINLARDFHTQFSADYFVKEITQEEYPEHFI
jgi:hypothetical protein